MEHMDMRWFARGGLVCTEGVDFSWNICETCGCLPSDVTGEATARRICDEHNAALSARLALREPIRVTEGGVIVKGVTNA